MKRPMTDPQRVALLQLCHRYGVPFDEDSFERDPFDLPTGYVAGWIGSHIYVGCSPEGHISS